MMVLRSIIDRSRQFLALFGLLAVSGYAAPVEIVLQQGHEVEVSAAVYSPDGRIIASAGESETIRLWDRASGDLVGTLPGHPERVVGLAFSPDGRWLASSSTDGSVKLWDYRAGRLVHLFTNHVGNWARRVAFSLDSRWLVPAAYDGKVSVWDVASGALVRTLSTKARIADVLFTPDGRFVVTASREANSPLIRFWDTTTGEPGLVLNHSNQLNTIAISRDGRLLASGGGKGAVNLWELPSGRILRSVLTPEKGDVLDIDLSADGKLLAAAGQWVNTVWTTDSGALLHELRGHEDGTVQISFSPDGRELATGSSDATVRLWNVRDGSLKRILNRRPPNTPVTSLAFSADGRFEALGTANGIVRVWDASDGSFNYDLRGHEGPIHALGFSADGKWLFSGSVDRTMRVWDMGHGTVSAVHPYFDRVDAMGTLAVGGRQGLIASASGPLASPSLDHSIKLWSSHFDRPIRVLRGHTAGVRSVTFTPGSDLLASASVDGTMKLWNSQNGECLRTLTNTVLPEVLAFTPGSQGLAAGMGDGTVRVLDTGTLATVREWRAHQRPVQSLAISGNGQWLATASTDRSVAVWNWETGRELRRFTNITSQYLPLAFHPKQPVLAFAQRDEMVVHANMETGEILFQRVIFPDGEWLAWNPAKSFFAASPHGDEHARARFTDQLVPVYPLELYRGELRRGTNLLAALTGPAPVLAPKNFELWWHRYPYKRVWLYGGLAVLLVWTVIRLRRGWLSERRRRIQEAFSRRLMESQEAERKRIAAELHDGLGQNLLIIKNRALLGLKLPCNDAALAEHLEEISGVASQAIAEAKEIAHDLRPHQLDSLGLAKAIKAMVNQAGRAANLSVEVEVIELDGALPQELHIHLYRIIQESLNNIIKHAHASKITLRMSAAAGWLHTQIQDDGCGMARSSDSKDSISPSGFGLQTMAERVKLLGGRFSFESEPGRGTNLILEIPLIALPLREN